MKFTVLFILFSVTLCLSSPCLGQKISLEEVLSKHLDSIGSKEKRESVKNMVVLSDVQVAVKGNSTLTSGVAVVASSGAKNIWGMTLNSLEYPKETFAFNGKDTKIGFIRPGVRSTLGGFIFTSKEVLKEGLLGGVLLSSWTMLNPTRSGAKLTLQGTKKVDGREAHIVEYMVKGGSDLTIKFFFDAETFRHVRTEYSRYIAARQGNSVDSSAGQSPDRYEVTEEFSNFQAVSGLTVPRTYKIKYRYSGNSVGAAVQAAQNSAREVEWAFTVTNLSVNQDLNDGAFEVDQK